LFVKLENFGCPLGDKVFKELLAKPAIFVRIERKAQLLTATENYKN